MRILIVEDDPDASRLLKKYLAPLGECEEAENGQEAVRAVQRSLREEYPFDLICLDIMMPAMDGHETLQEIRQIERREGLEIGEGIKVLMTSALSDNNTILQTYMELCDGYIVKPFTQQELFDKLHEIADVRQLGEAE